MEVVDIEGDGHLVCLLPIENLGEVNGETLEWVALSNLFESPAAENINPDILTTAKAIAERIQSPAEQP